MNTNQQTLPPGDVSANARQDLSVAHIPHSSADDLTAAQNQVQALKQSVGTITRHIDRLSRAIKAERQQRSRIPTPYLFTTETRTDEQRSCTGFYDGEVKFGLAQMKDRLVPTIYEILDNFPECNESGYCRVQVGDDVTRGIDHNKMNGYTVHALDGYQSAAVGLESWHVRDELQGLVCSVFIAAGEEGTPIADFQFQDMRTAEIEADAVELDGRALFCSTIESALERCDRPYLVIPTELTSEWRQSAGLPAESCLDCGDQLSQTAGKIPGIHTPCEYVSSDICSATGMHVEDALLCSVNVVLAGAPKVWLMIPPRCQEIFETQIRNHLSDSFRPAQGCSQSVRHMDALLSPILLDRWGIPYHIIVCKAGQMVVTLPGTYHQVVNAGPNYAQAINFAMPNWAGPPSGYRFCGEACPQTDAPTSGHFCVQRVPQSQGQQNRSDESDDEDPNGEDGEDGEDKDEVRRNEDGSESCTQDKHMTDVSDQSDQEEDEAEEQIREGMREVERSGQANTMQQSSECNLDLQQGVDSVEILSSAFVCQVLPANQANGPRFNAVETLNEHMAKELRYPGKRRVSLAGNEIGSGHVDFGHNDNKDSTEASIEEDINGNTDHCHILHTMLNPKLNQWSDCVFRAAEGGGFDVQGVVQAFHSAPTTEPVEKVLRALQFICEIANIPLLLQIRERLLTDPAAMTAMAVPAASDNPKDVQSIVQLHHNISMLRTVSWAAQYQLALHQLQYYEQFEALVERNRTWAAKGRKERRNYKKRKASHGMLPDQESSPLSPVRTEVLVKRQIISSMIGHGTSEKAAKEDLEKYLERGKKLHLFLGSASQSLLALFPLYGTEATRPSLDLLSYGPPAEIPKQAALKLRRPVESSS